METTNQTNQEIEEQNFPPLKPSPCVLCKDRTVCEERAISESWAYSEQYTRCYLVGRPDYQDIDYWVLQACCEGLSPITEEELAAFLAQKQDNDV